MKASRNLTMYRAHLKCHAYAADACPFLAVLPNPGVQKFTCTFVLLPKRNWLLPQLVARACADPFDDTSQTQHHPLKKAM